MAATILNSPRATEVSVYVVRAFVRLREMLASNAELAKRLDDLEQKTEAQSMRHDTLARNTRVQLKQVFDAIHELMAPPEPQPKRPIGFVIPEEKPAKPNGHGRNATPDNEAYHDRFPHPPPKGEGANESLRVLHVKAAKKLPAGKLVGQARKQ